MTRLFSKSPIQQRVMAWSLAAVVSVMASIPVSLSQVSSAKVSHTDYTGPVAVAAWASPEGMDTLTGEHSSPFDSPEGYLAQGFAPLQGYVVTVPAGTYVQGTMQSSLTSETARAGDRFYVTLGSPLMSGGNVALPAGSMVEGQVISVTSAGRAGRNGQMDIRFTSALTPTGQRIPLSARLQTEDGTGVLKGGTGTSRAVGATKRAAGGAAAGAILGTALGALSGGSVGRGAIYGTAVGGGLGAVAAGINKGEDAFLNAGEPVQLVLDTPVTTSQGADMPAPQASPYGNNYGGLTQQNGNYSYNQTGGQPYNQPQPNTYYGQQQTQTQNYGNAYGNTYQQPTNTYTTQPTNPYGY